MLTEDYLMRIIIQYAEALRRSWSCAREQKDPEGAAEMLDAAIGEATEIDGGTLLRLAPESMARILQVSGTDPEVISYVMHGLALSSVYFREAGNEEYATLRHGQAQALADAYGLEMPDDPEDLSNLPDYEEEADQ